MQERSRIPELPAAGNSTESRTLELQVCCDHHNPNPNCCNPTSKAVKIKTIHYDACGDADDRECLNDEYVVLENTNSVAVNMQGWILKDEANHRFEFPYFILNPGKTVTVHTGKGANTATDLYWNRGTAVWNNDHDTAYLYDSEGYLIDSYSY